ncbi:MAG: nuclear transport factor 2 family protein [Acidobacteriota bacterium]
MLIATECLSRRVFMNRSGKIVAGMALSLPALPVIAAPLDLEKILRDHYAAFEAMDMDKALSFFTEDCFFQDHTFHVTLRNLKEIREAFLQVQPRYLKFKMEITNLIISENQVVSQHIQSGTMRLGANAEPKDYSVHGVSILEFAGGKIKRQTDFYDVLGFRKQVGLKSQEQ